MSDDGFNASCSNSSVIGSMDSTFSRVQADAPVKESMRIMTAR